MCSPSFSMTHQCSLLSWSSLRPRPSGLVSPVVWWWTTPTVPKRRSECCGPVCCLHCWIEVGGVDQSRSARGTTGREGEDLTYTTRLYDSWNFSCFRFYLCLFSGPSTFLPKVRDSELSGVCLLGFLLVRLGLVPVERA